MTIFDDMKEGAALKAHIEPLAREWLDSCSPQIKALPLDYQTAQLNGFILSSIAISTKRMADTMDKILAHLQGAPDHREALHEAIRKGEK